MAKKGKKVSRGDGFFGMAAGPEGKAPVDEAPRPDREDRDELWSRLEEVLAAGGLVYTRCRYLGVRPSKRLF